MKIIGVTGNIGSGKTTVSKILEDNGAYVINADIIARDVLAKDGAGYVETVDFFGKETLKNDGEIDRAHLAKLVFSDKNKLTKLNEITHKHVLKKIDELIEQTKKAGSHKLICLDVPLLFESGLDKLCNATWVVDAPYETKLKRASERDYVAEEVIKSRLDAQTKSDDLRKKSDTIIENDKGQKELLERVLTALSELLER